MLLDSNMKRMLQIYCLSRLLTHILHTYIHPLYFSPIMVKANAYGVVHLT